MVVKADGVEPSIHEGAFTAIGMKSGWMSLDDEDDHFWTREFADITSADFNALKLPRVTYENSPVEIEIMRLEMFISINYQLFFNYRNENNSN